MYRTKIHEISKHKIPIISGFILGFNIYDSYIFRKETCPYKNNYIISQDYYDFGYQQDKKEIYQNTTFSQFMKPFRQIKNYFWIKSIHNKLIYGLEDNKIIKTSQYENFLRDYPYSDDLIYTSLYKNSNYENNINQTDYKKPRKEWLFEELLRKNNCFANKDNLMSYIDKLEFVKYPRELVKKVLWNELFYKSDEEIQKNDNILKWCFEQIFFDSPNDNEDQITIFDIFKKLSEYDIDKIPYYFYDLKYLEDNIRIKLFNNFDSLKKFDITQLLFNDKYLQFAFCNNKSFLIAYITNNNNKYKHNSSKWDHGNIYKLQYSQLGQKIFTYTFEQLPYDDKIKIANYMVRKTQHEDKKSELNNCIKLIYDFLSDHQVFIDFIKQSNYKKTSYTREEYFELYVDDYGRRYSKYTESNLPFDLLKKIVSHIYPDNQDKIIIELISNGYYKIPIYTIKYGVDYTESGIDYILNILDEKYFINVNKETLSNIIKNQPYLSLKEIELLRSLINKPT